MRYLQIGFCSLVLSTLSVAACGDDDATPGGTGGSSTGGSGKGGATATGGTAGSGFTGGSSGAATTGGTAGFSGSGTSGTAGTAGTGTSGTGGQGTGCPTTPPTEGATCSEDDSPDDCSYPGSVCECGGPG